MARKPRSPTETFSVRIPTELRTRLRAMAERLNVSENQIFIWAADAALDAYEANGERIVIPFELEPRHRVPSDDDEAAVNELPKVKAPPARLVVPASTRAAKTQE